VSKTCTALRAAADTAMSELPSCLAGDRAFCAGMDLTAPPGTVGKPKPGAPPPPQRTTVTWNQRHGTPDIIHSMDTPLVCAMNGSAAGWGMDLALNADIRVMSERAKLSAAMVKRGIVPESGGTWILPRLVGWAKASELILTGETLTAPECLEMGLVNHVVPFEEVMSTAMGIALKIAGNAPLAVQAAKRMMKQGMSEPPVHPLSLAPGRCQVSSAWPETSALASLTLSGRLRRRDLPRPRGARVPTADTADEDERLQGRRAVLP